MRILRALSGRVLPFLFLLSLVSYNNGDYMIIKYSNGPSFQRQGIEDGSGEIYYNSLDELYEADLIDGINLKRDWYKIREIHLLF